MQIDSASSPDMPGMGELGISPHSIEEILQDILKKPPIEKKPKQDLDCGKADYAIPPRAHRDVGKARSSHNSRRPR
jgi:hypothetical protein